MRHQFYRMDDANPSGMIETDSGQLDFWNRKRCGIFLTVNDFNGPRRAANLRQINALAVDLDCEHPSGKGVAAKTIQSGLNPSRVIETKRGFHVWFYLKNGDPRYWNNLMLDRLVPFYGADKNARDICRVLRAPGFYHWKDPSDPFLVREVFADNVSYTMEQIAHWYPDQSKPAREEFIKRESTHTHGDSFWENVWRLDCKDALDRLSGLECVNHETYSFKQQANGNLNIYVDGKGSSCWVDTNGRIGSLSGGGPSVYQWIRWYGHSPKKAAALIETLFPETKGTHGTV